MAGTSVIYSLIARDAASTQFNQIGRAADGLGGKMGKLGKVAEGLGLALAGVGAGALEAADKAAEFQASMTKIQTMAGGTAKDVASLNRQVLKLATTAQQGPQELSEALYHLKSVGMDNVQAMQALKEGSDLAAVGGANLEETVNALAGAWRTGIKGAGSFHQAVSTVNAIIGAGNMSMDQFNAAIGTGILPSAKTFGLSMQQVGAALALMTDEGIDSASAATRLRMSFSLMGAPSKAAEKQLGEIGLTGLKLADAMRGKDGLIGALTLLKDHLDASGLSASQQSQVLSRAFGGGKSSSGILLMLNNLDVLVKKQDQVNASIGKFDDAVKTQRETAEAQWKILTSNLETMTIQLGTKLLPPLTEFTQYLSQTALPTALKAGAAIRKLIPVDTIRTDAARAAGIVSGFLDQIGVTGAVKGARKSLADRLGLSAKPKPPPPYAPQPTTAPHLGTGKTAPSNLPVGPPLQAAPHLGSGSVGSAASGSLQAAPHLGSGNVAPLTGGGKKAKELSAAQKQGRQYAQVFTAAVSAVDWRQLGASIGRGLQTAVGWAAAHSKELSKKLASAIGGVDFVDIGKTLGKTALPLAIGIITSLFDPLFTVDFWKKHWLDTIIAVISVIPIGKVGASIGKLGSKIPWGKVGELIGKGWSKIPWGTIFSIGDRINWSRIFSVGGRIDWSKVFTINGVVPAIGRWAGRIIGKVQDAFTSSTWLSTVTGWLGRQFGRLGGWISDQVGLLPTRFGLLAIRLDKWLTDHVPFFGNGFFRGVVKLLGRFTFWQTGVNLVEGLYNGIVAKLEKLPGWLKANVSDPFIGHVKALFGIHSPSTVFAGIGGDLIAGLLVGTLAAAAGIGKWLHAHVVTPTLAAFAGAGTWLLSKGSALVSGLKNGTVSGAKGLAGWMTSHVVDPARSAFSAAGSWLLSRGSSMVSGLKTGTVNGAKGIGSWMSAHVISPVKSPFSKASSWLHGPGGDAITGLKSGITAKMAKIGSWVKANMVDPVVGAVKKYFGIHSPSTVFAELGGHLTAGLMKGMAQGGGTSIAHKVFGSLPSALGSLVKKGLVHIESLPGKALKALGGLGGDFLSLLGLGGGGSKGGAARWSDTVKAVLSLLGAPSSALGAVLTRIGIESGGNPNAINLWDSNAKAGHPSQGLMQTIPSTFSAYAGPFASLGITDPFASIYAGVNYAMHRYGKNWISVMTRPGGYDQGGIAAGEGLLAKYTNRPERVLSPRQTEAFERLVDILDHGGAAGGGGGQEIHLHFDDPALRDLIRVETRPLIRASASEQAFRATVGRRN